MKKIVSFENYTFRYAKQTEATLKNINLDIYQGETLLILGASGSGKSTLAKCLNGLIPHQFKGESQGKLLLFGKEQKEQNIFSLSNKVGSVLQDTDAQFVSISVEEDIAFSLENQNVSVQEMKEKVQQAAERVDILALLKMQPFSLSGGQKQRVSLAGVLHNNIEMLLLDEPLAALDPAMSAKTIELLHSLKQEGKTVVIIEHRLEEVLHCPVDRIALMHEGELITVQKPDDLLASGLLAKYGIREPLYLNAVQHFLGSLPQKNLASFEQFDFLPYAEQIKKLQTQWQTEELSSPPSNRETILFIENLSFSYTEKDFMYIEKLKIEAGERIALLGENGCGKSTLAKLMTGLLKAQKGKILRKGNPLTLKEISMLIGYVMQNPNQMLVCPSLYEEVALALRLRKMEESSIEQRVTQVLRLTGLYEMRHWPSSVLSYGQKKRLTVALVLALEPACLLLDEPTAGQDYAHYREIMEFVDHLNQNYGLSLVFITHDLHLALEYTDRAIVLEKGKILLDAPTFEVLNNEGVLQRASLKKSSLFKMAEKLSLPKTPFLKTFIQKEKEQWKHGK